LFNCYFFFFYLVIAEVELYKGEELINNWTGAKRIDNLQIGEFTIVADAKKFRRVEKTIEIKENITEELFLDLAAEKQYGRKGKFTAVALSAAIPGLGQYYSGYKSRSIIYAISGIGTGAMVLRYNSEFKRMLVDYENSKVAYHNADALVDIDNSRNYMYDNYDELKRLDELRQIFFISFASIYGINIIDAFIFGKKKEKKTREGGLPQSYFDIQPTPVYGGFGLQLKYTF